MSERTSIRAGGWSLIVGSILFMAVFAYLAARFNYPAILDGTAAHVLPDLLATGGTGRAVWTLYAFLPLIWIPAGVGGYLALRESHPGGMLVALMFALTAALTMMIGLMRWPSVHWSLAQLQTTASPEQQQVIASIFDGLNTYLGNFIGEFLGELSFSLFFLFSSWALWRSGKTQKWIAGLGLLTAAAGLIGMFRNLTPLVAPVAAINNYLLPLWMIVFGVILVRYRSTPLPTLAT
jgi:uncharacterized protein DUF4386